AQAEGPARPVLIRRCRTATLASPDMTRVEVRARSESRGSVVARSPNPWTVNYDRQRRGPGRPQAAGPSPRRTHEAVQRREGTCTPPERTHRQPGAPDGRRLRAGPHPERRQDPARLAPVGPALQGRGLGPD